LCETDRKGWDYFDIEASLDVDKDEYVWFGQESPDTSGGFLTTVASINEELTKAVSQEVYNSLKEEVLADVMEEHWWRLSKRAEMLYGIKNVVGKIIDITAGYSQEVHAWNFREFGITPISHERKQGLRRFLVQVDFHF
jgi:hypothetical protein